MGAVSVEAGEALALLCDTFAGVSAIFVSFLAEGDRRFIDILGDWFADFDHHVFVLFLLSDHGDHKAESG